MFRSSPGVGELLLSPTDTVEATGDSVVHVHGSAKRVWAFNRATVHIWGEVDEVYVLGNSNVHIHAKCRMVSVGMEGTAWIEDDNAAGTEVLVDEWGDVHAKPGVRIRAYGEAHVYAPAGTSVSIGAYARWYTGTEVKGNLDNYRAGYYRPRYGRRETER